VCGEAAIEPGSGDIVTAAAAAATHASTLIVLT
jgi:hypothetical protein